MLVSDESRVTFGGGRPIDVPLGRFFFGPELVSAPIGWVYGLNTVAITGFAAIQTVTRAFGHRTVCAACQRCRPSWCQ